MSKRPILAGIALAAATGCGPCAPPPPVAPPAAPVVSDDCRRLCETLSRCLPEGMAKLELVQRSFPVDCANQCAALPPAEVACAIDRSCHELQVGTCGASIGEKVRALGGP